MFLIGWNHELCRVPYGTLGNLGGGTDECHMALLVGKGLSARLAIRKQGPSRLPLARSPEYKSSATLANSQQVCLRPVGILNPVKLDLIYLFQAFTWLHQH